MSQRKVTAQESRRRATSDRIVLAAYQHVDVQRKKGAPIDSLSMTKLAKLAGHSPSTVTRYFKTWDEVCLALVEFCHQNGLDLPDRVHSNAESHRQLIRSRAQELESGPRSSLECVRAFRQSIAEKNVEEIVGRAVELIDSLSLTQSGQSDDRELQKAENCKVWSELTGSEPRSEWNPDMAVELTIVVWAIVVGGPPKIQPAVLDAASLQNLMRLNDQVVDAHRHIKVDEPAHLMSIIKAKRFDVSCSVAAGLNLRAALDQFHINRAEALLERNESSEIDCMINLVDRLRSFHKDHALRPGSDEILMLYARAIAMAVAYPTNSSLIQSNALRALSTLFRDPSARRDSQALLHLVRSTEPPPPAMDFRPPQASRPDYSSPLSRESGREILGSHILRASRFPGIGEFLIARQLANWAARLCDRDLIATFSVLSNDDRPNNLRLAILDRSLGYYASAQSNFRSRGCAGVISALAGSEIRDTRQLQQQASDACDLSTTEGPVKKAAIQVLLQQINSLTLNSIIRERLSYPDLAALVKQLEAVSNFVKDPGAHAVPDLISSVKD